MHSVSVQCALQSVCLSRSAVGSTVDISHTCSPPMTRHALLKAGGIPLLLGLLAANPLALKVEQPRVAAHLAGTLLNMVAGDGDSTAAKHMFVKAGGMEIGCKVRVCCAHAML